MRELDFHRFKTGNPKNIKIRQLKKKNRKSSLSIDQEDKEIQMIFGSVWGIKDRQVSFDKNRKTEHLKGANRPCLVLMTPLNFGENNLVNIAPGTTKINYSESNTKYVLTAEVPPENLNQTTYFKLYFREYVFQKFLSTKFCDLSAVLQDKLKKIINE